PKSPLHGGSVLAVARRALEDPPISSRVQAVLQQERASGLKRLAGYAAMAQQAASVKRDLLEFLDSVRARGLRVAGYSAPSRGTTLLNFCGVGAASVPFVVDRDPDKQDRYLPGCHIPIRAPAELEAARPGSVFILAWPLAPEVMAQMAVVRTWGGRFVVAVPQL